MVFGLLDIARFGGGVRCLIGATAAPGVRPVATACPVPGLLALVIAKRATAVRYILGQLFALPRLLRELMVLLEVELVLQLLLDGVEIARDAHAATVGLCLALLPSWLAVVVMVKRLRWRRWRWLR